MADLQDYDAVAGTIEISDITSGEGNASILRSLKTNSSSLTKLGVNVEGVLGHAYYVPRNAHEFTWLGYYIGMNTQLEELAIGGDIAGASEGEADITADHFRFFCECLKRNKSVYSLQFVDFGNNGPFRWKWPVRC